MKNAIKVIGNIGAISYDMIVCLILVLNFYRFLVKDHDGVKPKDSSENFNFIALIYWVGFGSIILRLIYTIVRLIRLKTKFGVNRYESGRIVHTDLLQPFSFFNLIFLPKGEVNPLILEHEKAHVRHRHWIDLLLLEIAGAVLHIKIRM